MDSLLRSTLQAGNGNTNAKPDYADVKDLVQTCMTGLAVNSPADSQPAAPSNGKIAENADSKALAQRKQ